MNYKILITVIFMMCIGIIVLSVYKGIALRDVTVVDDPYEAGLRYDATHHKHAELGWKVVVPPTLDKDRRLYVYVYDKNGRAMDNASVELLINRIGSPDTKRYRAEHAGNGMYAVRADFSSRGYWEVKVNVTHGHDTLSFDNRIHIDG